MDEAEMERVRVAYDRLWHRVCAHEDGEVLSHLPTPHQLRTGERRQDVLARFDRLRAGHQEADRG